MVRILRAVVIASALFFAGPAAAGTDQLFSIAGFDPIQLALGTDGALWFTETLTNSSFATDTKANLGRIAPDGTVTQYTIPVPFVQTDTLITTLTIASGPDGNLWLPMRGFVARVTTDGIVTKFPTTTVGYYPDAITAGPDGNMWFGETPVSGTPVMAKISMAGAVTEYALPSASQPGDIVTGPDGNLWFTDAGLFSINKITPEGVLTTYPLPTGDTYPFGAANADGKIWFTEPSSDVIGSITTGGVITKYKVPSGTDPGGLSPGPNGTLLVTASDGTIGSFDPQTGILTKYGVPAPTGVYGIALGSDGNVWYTAGGISQIGRLAFAPDGPLVAAVLPSGRTVTVGNTATVFGTIINAGTVPATGCTVAPATVLPASFTYQTTDPATNAVIGTPNTAVTIAPGAAQSFVLSLTPTGTYDGNYTTFAFHCANAGYAPASPAVNSLFFGAVSAPAPDIVAVAVTPTRDGTLAISGSGGSAAFAVATTNLGISGSVSVSAFPADQSMPVTLTLCQTNPASGQCISSVASTIDTTIAAGATPTFAIFATATGAIPFNPRTERILVSFDSGGDLGLTSVAVKSE